jgi:hypothetical protein
MRQPSFVLAERQYRAKLEARLTRYLLPAPMSCARERRMSGTAATNPMSVGVVYKGPLLSLASATTGRFAFGRGGNVSESAEEVCGKWDLHPND